MENAYKILVSATYKAYKFWFPEISGRKFYILKKKIRKQLKKAYDFPSHMKEYRYYTKCHCRFEDESVNCFRNATVRSYEDLPNNIENASSIDDLKNTDYVFIIARYIISDFQKYVGDKKFTISNPDYKPFVDFGSKCIMDIILSLDYNRLLRE